MKPSKEELAVASAILKEMKVPQMPQAVLTFQALLNEEEPDINAVAETIASDIALSGSVMQLVNRGGRKINSIHGAVVYLGLDKLKTIVLTAALREAMQPETDFQLEFWESALACASGSQAFSVSNVRAFPENSYMLGLFHDAGALLLEKKDKRYPEIYKRSHSATESVLELERRFFRTTHVALSYALARLLALPSEVQQAIYYSHVPEHSAYHLDDEVNALISTIKICRHEIGRLLYPEIEIRREGSDSFLHAVEELSIDNGELQDFTDELDMLLQPE